MKKMKKQSLQAQKNGAIACIFLSWGHIEDIYDPPSLQEFFLPLFCSTAFFL
jgi:hypothetical protein